jgi:exopolysaccharide biosynthesis polyprenyl glycosylphosphotransferase
LQPAEEILSTIPGPGLRGPGTERAEIVDLPGRPEPAAPGAQAFSHSLSLGRYVAWLVVADTVVAALCAFLAVILRFSGSPATLNGISYVDLVPAFLVAWLTIMWLAGTYDRRVLVSGTEEFRRVLNGAVWTVAAVALVGFAAHIEVSRSVIAMALASATLLSLGARYGARLVIQGRLRAHATLHRAVVVGTKDEAQGLVTHMQRNAHVGFAVTAVHTPPPSGRTVGERIAEILAIARQTGADTVAVAGTSGFDSSQLRRLAWGLEGTGLRFLMVPALTDLAGPRIRVHPVDGLPLLHIEQPEFTGPKLAIKRCMDLVGGTLISIMLLPVLLAVAVAVLIGSGPPIVYTQIRVGRHGELFKMFKFRTMVSEADKRAEAQADGACGTSPVRPKPERDPRVTRVGAFLRRHSLDELPQLLNVLAGSMSLVGPRPHRPFEVAEYADDVRRRLLIKPGLTGLWQVSGRAALPWEENVRLDLRYMENWSIWLDALLILKTLRAVILPRGAY